ALREKAGVLRGEGLVLPAFARAVGRFYPTRHGLIEEPAPGERERRSLAFGTRGGFDRWPAAAFEAAGSGFWSGSGAVHVLSLCYTREEEAKPKMSEKSQPSIPYSEDLRTLWRQRHGRIWTFYCPQCRAARRTPTHPDPAKLENFARIGLCALVFMIATW